MKPVMQPSRTKKESQYKNKDGTCIIEQTQTRHPIQPEEGN